MGLAGPRCHRALRQVHPRAEPRKGFLPRIRGSTSSPEAASGFTSTGAARRGGVQRGHRVRARSRLVSVASFRWHHLLGRRPGGSPVRLLWIDGHFCPRIDSSRLASRTRPRSPAAHRLPSVVAPSGPMKVCVPDVLESVWAMLTIHRRGPRGVIASLPSSLRILRACGAWREAQREGVDNWRVQFSCQGQRTPTSLVSAGTRARRIAPKVGR